MNKILLTLAATMIGPLSALITTRVFDYVDDVQKWTAKLPDSTKQIIVMFLGAVIPVANAQFGLQLPSDLGILSEPSVQSIISVALAFVLKGHAKAATVAANG